MSVIFDLAKEYLEKRGYEIQYDKGGWYKIIMPPNSEEGWLYTADGIVNYAFQQALTEIGELQKSDKKYQKLLKTSQAVYDNLSPDIRTDDLLHLENMEAYNDWQDTLDEFKKES